MATDHISRATHTGFLLRTSLGAGEREAIALALEKGARGLIMDERLGRNVALRLGLPVISTVRLLLMAKQQRIISAVRPLLDQLMQESFRLSARLYQTALAEAGEA